MTAIGTTGTIVAIEIVIESRVEIVIEIESVATAAGTEVAEKSTAIKS